MDAPQALADLIEVSSQIYTAVIVGPAGEVLGSTLAGDGAERLAAAAAELVTASLQTARADSPELVQLEAATAEGSVFVVRDGGRMIAATTASEPTAGLVFYDLKSCLRAATQPEGKPRPAARRPAHTNAPEQGDDAA